MTEDPSARTAYGRLWWVALAAALVVVLLPAISRDASHLGRAVLALAGLGLIAGHLWLLRTEGEGLARLVWRGLVVAAAVLAVGNYFQFDRRVFAGISDYTDVSYYYVNAKYFPELGYTGLYGALLQADREREEHKTDTIRTVRNLSDYSLYSDDEAQMSGRRLRDDAFTAERWQAFGHDGNMLLQGLTRAQLETNFFVDHGYNPPPSWTLIGRPLASATPVLYTPTLTHLDTVLVAGMFLAVTWAFGPDLALLGLLWFCVTFSGRWPILGQALLRFDWLAALVIGVCLLKKERWGGAGAALAYAAANRIFPVIFLAAPLARIARDAWGARELRSEHRRFLVGAGVVMALLVGGSALQFGPRAWQASVHNLWMHNQTYSSHRVGLGDVLVYRGETTREAIHEGGGMRAKEEAIRALQGPLRAVGLVALGLVVIGVVRGRGEAWEQVGWAALPLFCITNAQVNYWNLRLVLVIWHLASLRRDVAPPERRAHGAGLALLLLTELATQAVHVAGADRYAVTTTTSLGVLLYLAGLAAWIAREARRV